MKNKIDIKKIIRALNPITIGYSIKELSNIKLDKKTKYVAKKISIPPEIIDIEKNINLDHISDSLKPYIEYFVDTLEANYDSDMLSIMYNNLNSLIVFEKDSQYAKKKHLEGTYNSRRNSIIIFNNNIGITLYHELLHMASTIFKNGVIYTGFHQRTYFGKNEDIGKGLNEGYTELLTQRLFSNEDDRIGYYFERFVASYVEELVGEDKMASLFFKGNLKGLIEELTAYNSEENVIFFIKCLDYFCRNWRDKSCHKNNDTAITYCQYFIFDSYLNKY